MAYKFRDVDTHIDFYNRWYILAEGFRDCWGGGFIATRNWPDVYRKKTIDL